MKLLNAFVLASLLTGWLASTGAHAAQGSGRLLVFFVDDLHLDFRSTPRLRVLLVQLVPRLVGDGDSVAIMTTGFSSVAVGPTTEPEVALSALRRISGGALHADEILEKRGIRERRRRARIAIATARRTIKSLDAISTGPRMMIYVSGGYGEQDLTSVLAEVAATANSANTTIHALDARSLMDGPNPAPSISNQAAWDAYHRDAQSSLWALAGSTGGHFISTGSEIDRLMDQIGSTRERSRQGSPRQGSNVQFRRTGDRGPKTEDRGPTTTSTHPPR